MSVMDEKDSELLGRIALGEDSVLELKGVEFRGNRIIGPRRSDMADELAVPSSSIDDLTPRLWKRFRTPLSSQNNREFLEKMRLITRDISDEVGDAGEGGDVGEFRPSVAGILMTSDAPESSIPNAFIQAVCYRGTRRSGSYQLDAKDITGPLDVQIAGACRFVERNMRVFAVKAPCRIETPQFSMNAVAHRDYSIYASKIRLHLFSDRLEIHSPGCLPSSMTVESIAERQSSRNELLTSLLARTPMNVDAPGSRRGFIMDKRGDGVPVIITESEELSGRRPEYRLLDDAELLLTIFAAPEPGVRPGLGVSRTMPCDTMEEGERKHDEEVI